MSEVENNSKIDTGENKSEKGILIYDDNEKQTVFKFLGIEMTAPKDLRNPRIIYIAFILINLILIIILKSLTKI